MAFPNIHHGSEEEAHNVTTTSQSPNGQLMMIEDGRTFRYAEDDGTGLADSRLCQSIVPSANFLAEAIGTLAAGVTTLTGIGATTGNCAASLLVDGYCFSTTVTNLNPVMRIKDNTLCTAAAATGTITLYNPTVAAFAAADTISYILNPWKDVLIHPSPPTSTLAGVTMNAIAASSYGWLQTSGICRILIDGTVALGSAVRPSEDDDGGVALLDFDEADDANHGQVGFAAEIGSDTACGLIWLSLE